MPHRPSLSCPLALDLLFADTLTALSDEGYVEVANEKVLMTKEGRRYFEVFWSSYEETNGLC